MHGSFDVKLLNKSILSLAKPGHSQYVSPPPPPARSLRLPSSPDICPYASPVVGPIYFYTDGRRLDEEGNLKTMDITQRDIVHVVRFLEGADSICVEEPARYPGEVIPGLRINDLKSPYNLEIGLKAVFDQVNVPLCPDYVLDRPIALAFHLGLRWYVHPPRPFAVRGIWLPNHLPQVFAPRQPRSRRGRPRAVTRRQPPLPGLGLPSRGAGTSERGWRRTNHLQSYLPPWKLFGERHHPPRCGQAGPFATPARVQRLPRHGLRHQGRHLPRGLPGLLDPVQAAYGCRSRRRPFAIRVREGRDKGQAGPLPPEGDFRDCYEIHPLDLAGHPAADEPASAGFAAPCQGTSPGQLRPWPHLSQFFQLIG